MTDSPVKHLCETCEWWWPLGLTLPVQPDRKFEVGQCKRWPRRPPQCDGWEWCGEWRERTTSFEERLAWLE